MSILSFLQAIDLFGVTFAFRYKSKEKYKTALGGFFVLLFLILALVMGIYYFIPFINRKNYTIVYYTMNLAATEEVSLFSSESNFAVGLNCENNDNEKLAITDILDLKSRYVLYIKSRDGTYKKDAKNLVTHKCTYDDFYNKYDKQMDYLGVSNYECVENKEDSIQGIYADQVFSYFEFSVLAKNKSNELINEIQRFLFENDCKLEFVYTDIIIDLDNYKNPFTQYLSVVFIQLNPTLFIKRNIYFMNQYFTDDDYLMFVFEEGDTSEIKPLYSRYEEYSLYKGMDRVSEKPEEYDYYSKVYVRAETKRTIIKRKYQKFMEFYADASSLLIAIYEIVNIIFNYIDYFYANHSLAKLIFFFKDLDEENSFNIHKKQKKILELLSVTEAIHSKNNSEENESKGFGNTKKMVLSPSTKDTKTKSGGENNKEENKKEVVKIYNNKKKNNLNKNDVYNSKSNKLVKSQKYNENININSNSNKFYNYMKEKENLYDMEENLSKYRRNNYNAYKRGESLMKFKFKSKDLDEVDDYDESIDTEMEDYSSESGYEKKRKKKNIRIFNSFNIFEILFSEFFKCCRWETLKIKSDALEKSYNIMFKKLDIITYVRNMILFDITNQINLDNSEKTIMNFLCRPIVSLDKNSKYEFEEFYRNYREKDFKKFTDEIQEMAHKTMKGKNENKLMEISNEHLKIFA